VGTKVDTDRRARGAAGARAVADGTATVDTGGGGRDLGAAGGLGAGGFGAGGFTGTAGGFVGAGGVGSGGAGGVGEV